MPSSSLCALSLRLRLEQAGSIFDGLGARAVIGVGRDSVGDAEYVIGSCFAGDIERMLGLVGEVEVACRRAPEHAGTDRQRHRASSRRGRTNRGGAWVRDDPPPGHRPPSAPGLPADPRRVRRTGRRSAGRARRARAADAENRARVPARQSGMATSTAPAGRTDEELLGDVADGDAGALRLLYERHAPWLMLRLRRRCSDPSLVEEVLQDTFLAVWRRPGGYRGEGEVAAWVWGIAIRRLVDRLRRRSLPMAWLSEDVGDGDALPSAEDKVLVGVEYGDLAGALARLSPELRLVIQATVLDGLTTREAAQLLCLPIGTVKTRALRARRQLREALT